MKQPSQLRVLFVSNMTVSPGSGGGTTVFRLLEPNPSGTEVFYASPVEFPSHWKPFEDIYCRTEWFSMTPEDGMLRLPKCLRIRPIRRWEEKFARSALLIRRHERWMAKQLLRVIRKRGIDVLLLCPQGTIHTSALLIQKVKVPAVTWFMDDYYSGTKEKLYLKQIWDKSYRRFVVSEAMQQRFSTNFGGECDVLNNSVIFPTYYVEPIVQRMSPLKLAYAGGLHAYYIESLTAVINAVEALSGRVVFNIYSHEERPAALRTLNLQHCHFLQGVSPERIHECLQSEDVLLSLSSFRPEHRAIAETSLASKTVDYLAAGRCMMVYGPEYAENVRYAERYNIGAVVTTPDLTKLQEMILFLADEGECRRNLGERAFQFGRTRHDVRVNRERLWDALAAAKLSTKREI